MVKEDTSRKHKGIYYPPRITAFDIEPIDILAGTDGGETPGHQIENDSGEFDWGSTKSLSYDPAWGDDEE